MVAKSRQHRFGLIVVASIVGLLGAGAAPAEAGLLKSLTSVTSATSDLTPTNIIVQQWDSTDPGPMALVASLGGTITRELPIIGGFAATVPQAAVPLVIDAPGVRVVSNDALVLPQEAPPSDGGPRSVYGPAIGATEVQQSGHRGEGVTVAVLDTGVADIPDLAGRVLPVADDAGVVGACVNFSTEPGCNDSYGHGTFIAGLIAGNGSSSAGAYVGVAPEANLVSVKLSGRDGVSTVSQLLAGIQWVVANKDTYGIRVMNLSLRVDSGLSYRLDPVNFAVEQAWAAGIVVVVAAGNSGPDAQTIAKPADDPWVISVGSTDDHGTVPLGDDTMASYSSQGPTHEGVAKPDVVVSGSHLISLRSPGSEADLRYPAFVDDGYRRGSGTSFSAGIVSGVSALYLSADPSATNDRVKYALTATAQPLGGVAAAAQGAGVVDVPSALNAGAGLANQTLFQPVMFPDAEPSADDLLGVDLTGSNWTGSNWTGSNWTGSNWTEFDWQAEVWTGSNWTGSNWTGSNWTGSNWTGSNWTGSNWTGSNWTSEYWH